MRSSKSSPEIHKLIPTTIRLPLAIVKTIDQQSKNNDRPRSYFLKHYIEQGLDISRRKGGLIPPSGGQRYYVPVSYKMPLALRERLKALATADDRDPAYVARVLIILAIECDA